MKAARLGGVAAALVLASASAGAQMYKWTDAKGTVHYTDTPPPANARVGNVKAAASSVQTGALPYQLAQAVRRHPVRLYTTPGCTPCDEARAYLNKRGIPYAEKTVRTDVDAASLRAAGGSGSAPFLLVGTVKSNGFDRAGLAAALTAAGYPVNSVLPSTYRQAAPEPAAPVAALLEVHPRVEPKVDSEPSTPRPSDQPKRADTPPGFQF